MPRIPRPAPAPATIIAFAALFVALGGPSQAAQLARKVTHHSHSLRGPRGPKGSFAKPIIVTAPVKPDPGSTVIASGVAYCPPHSILTGGGVDAGLDIVSDSTPLPSPARWVGRVIKATELGATGLPSGSVVAVCVPTS